MLKRPWRRLAAWLVDWLVVSVRIGALFGVGVPLYRSGALSGASPVVFNVLEARGRTIGKRNALQIALPWAIGHVAVYGFASTSLGPVPTWVYVVTGLAYVLPVTYVLSLFLRSGRTPYDRVASTMVTYDNKE